MLKYIGRTASRHPWSIIVLFILFTLFFASRMPSARFDPRIKTLLPDHMEARLNLDRIEAMFGGTEVVMIGFDSGRPGGVLDPDLLRRIDAVSEAFGEIPGVDRVMSLSTVKDIRGGSGFLEVDSFFAEGVPETPGELNLLRTRVEDNPMFAGTIVNGSWSATAVIAFLEEGADDEALLSGAADILSRHTGEAQVYLGGLPVVRAEAALRMQKDLLTFLPAGLLIMLLFLWLSFRDWRGMALPFLIVVQSIALGLGLGAAAGWQIQMLTILLPVILIAIANDYGIHLYARYQELAAQWHLEHPGRDPEKHERETIIERLTADLGGPIFWAGITTILGFLALSTHIITSARRLGIQAATGIGFALVGSLLFIPAMLTLLPFPPRKTGSRGEAARLPGTLFLERLSVTIRRHPGKILAATALCTIICSLGVFRLAADTNPIDFFPRGSQVRRSDTFLQKEFGGSTTINIVAEGDMKDPEVLQAMEKIETALEGREAITSTASITEVVRRMNVVLHDGDPSFDTLPPDRESIAQYFLLYSFSGDPEDFEKLVDFEYRNGLITARIAEPSSEVIGRETAFIEQWIDTHPDTPVALLGGFAVLLRDLTDALVRGQLSSLAVSLAVIFVLLSLLFRSLRTGALAILPLLMAAVSLFGLMGWTGIPLSTVTTMLTSIILGVGIDYTIHYLWHYRRMRSSGAEAGKAVTETLRGAGRGILFNALSVVIGFLVLLVSGFLPVRFFGFLIVLSISLCLYGALVVLPSIHILTSKGDR